MSVRLVVHYKCIHKNTFLSALTDASLRARSIQGPLTRTSPAAARVLATQFHTSSARMGLDDWKYNAPYKVHENDPNFRVRYEGGCHCGRVKYQLSRDKPLDSKYCHCTTCQTLHGERLPFFHSPSAFGPARLIHMTRCALSMGSHLPQGRHQLHQGPPRPRLV